MQKNSNSFLLVLDLRQLFLILVGPLVIKKPSSVIAEEGQNVSLLCNASGQPTPNITWRKAFSHLSKKATVVADGKLTILHLTKADGGAYACSAKNLLGEDIAIAQVMVIDRLKFTLVPPLKISTSTSSDVKLDCAAQGAREIVWKRIRQNPPQKYDLYPNFRKGALFLRNVSSNDAGSYTCVAKNSRRSIEATTVVEVFPVSCSSLKTSSSKSPSGNYIIDPDGEGGVPPFSVYCDMRDKGGIGVTVISHDSESRTHVNHINSGCTSSSQGCYRKDVTYTGVSTAQLASLTRVSQKL